MVRNRLMKTVLVICSSIWLSIYGAGSAESYPARDLDAVVKKLQQSYSSTRGFFANFRQLYVSNKTRKEESGQLFVKSPDKMRWEYQEPESKLFISDGKRTYLYLPEDKQVIVKKFSLVDAEPTLPFLFLLNKGNIKKYFTVEWERNEKRLHDSNYLIRLTPKKQQSEVAWIVLEINPSSYYVERLVVFDYTNTKAEFIITNFTPHITIDASKFVFKMPRNVEVINE